LVGVLGRALAGDSIWWQITQPSGSPMLHSWQTSGVPPVATTLTSAVTWSSSGLGDFDVGETTVAFLLPILGIGAPVSFRSRQSACSQLEQLREQRTRSEPAW